MPRVDMAGTGRNIQKFRREAGLSIREIAGILGLASGNAIYKWIHGECLPSIDNLVILAKILGVTIDQIIAVN